MKLGKDIGRGRFELGEPREMLAIEEFVRRQEWIMEALALIGVDLAPAEPMVGRRRHASPVAR